MGRPDAAPTPPQQAKIPVEVQLPGPMDLPGVPDLGGAPDFPPLNVPDHADAGIGIAVEVVPDFILDLG